MLSGGVVTFLLPDRQVFYPASIFLSTFDLVLDRVPNSVVGLAFGLELDRVLGWMLSLSLLLSRPALGLVAKPSLPRHPLLQGVIPA
jgi:hypothetical protein